MEDLELLFNLYVLSHLSTFSVLPVLSLHCQIGQILKFDRYCELNSQPSVSEKGRYRDTGAAKNHTSHHYQHCHHHHHHHQYEHDAMCTVSMEDLLDFLLK